MNPPARKCPEDSPLLSAFPPALSRRLITIDRERKLRNCILWGSINAALLTTLLYDIALACPLDYPLYVHYIEYAFAIIFFLNTIFHLIRYCRLSFLCKGDNIQPSLTSTPAVRRTGDVSHNITKLPSSSFSTPMRIPLDASFTSSPNSSLCNNSMSLSYNLNSSLTQSSSANTSPKMFPTLASTDEIITDENTLKQYLKEYESFEKLSCSDISNENSNSPLRSFWSHPVAQGNSKDNSFLLKKNQYQLSYLSHASTSNSSGSKTDEMNSSQTQNVDAWKYLNVKPVNLTQWNQNLRLWISKTILGRLVCEFDNISSALEKHNIVDIKIGSVGLDRLRKTAQSTIITQFVPTLPALIPFLELTTNQEYLVKRIKELAKGGSMSDFKWNGGSSFNDKEWNYSLPTDSAIIMHLFATYMDSQLMPLPNKPDVKPFSGLHFIKSTEKDITQSNNNIAIHNVSENPPHYRVIIGEEIYEFVKGYNNLFHCILFFLYQINKREYGMLGRVNLGRAGVNMLWIIDG